MAKNVRTLFHAVFGLNIDEDVMLLGIAYDSRRVQPGELFCAYQGYQADGRAYVDQAIEKGAKVILLENDLSIARPEWRHSHGRRVPIYKIANLKEKLGPMAAWFYGYPSQQLKVIGITGTNGKTSFCHLMAKALQALGYRCGVMGSLGNGFLDGLIPSDNTTMNAVEVQKQLAELRDKGAQLVAMEVSSHALDQGRVNGVEFALTVFSNLSQDHLDYHKTMKEYARSKQRLFDNQAPAIINMDDDFGIELIMELKQPLTVYTTKHIILNEIKHKFVQAINVDLKRSGFAVFVNTSWGDDEFISRLIGEFNVSNCLAVLAALLNLDIPFQEAIEAMQSLEPVPGRMECFSRKSKPTVFVDYAHTPDALKQALKNLKPLCQGRLICVFGCGGDRDREKRPQMAAIAEQYADQVILTQDNIRHEDPVRIIADIMNGFSSLDHVIIEQDREKAIQYAIGQARQNDIVLIAGKGRENYLLIGDERHAFSDIAVVERCLKGAQCCTI